MRRDYIESMKADGLGEFCSACEALRNCKFVVAETKISALLKSIADNRRLYSMFGVALYGFDYKNTFAECVGNNVFSLPADRKKAVALVFRILLDIDDGIMSLQNFLEAYFYGVSVNESFARFCLELIVPFESYCRELYSSADTAANENDLAMREAGGKFRAALKSDALDCISELVTIAETSIAVVIDRAEFTACLNGLTRAVNADDYDNIISAFLGVKYAVAYFFKSAKNVQDIYKKLEYDIKHLAD